MTLTFNSNPFCLGFKASLLKNNMGRNVGLVLRVGMFPYIVEKLRISSFPGAVKRIVHICVIAHSTSPTPFHLFRNPTQWVRFTPKGRTPFFADFVRVVHPFGLSASRANAGAYSVVSRPSISSPDQPALRLSNRGGNRLMAALGFYEFKSLLGCHSARVTNLDQYSNDGFKTAHYHLSRLHGLSAIRLLSAAHLVNLANIRREDVFHKIHGRENSSYLARIHALRKCWGPRG